MVVKNVNKLFCQNQCVWQEAVVLRCGLGSIELENLSTFSFSYYNDASSKSTPKPNGIEARYA